MDLIGLGADCSFGKLFCGMLSNGSAQNIGLFFVIFSDTASRE